MKGTFNNNILSKGPIAMYNRKEYSTIIFYQKEQAQNKVYLIRNSIPAHMNKLRTTWNIFHLFRKNIFPAGISLSQKGTRS